jgi:hypothetical protein
VGYRGRISCALLADAKGRIARDSLTVLQARMIIQAKSNPRKILWNKPTFGDKENTVITK